MDFGLDVFGYTPTRDHTGPPTATARRTPLRGRFARLATLVSLRRPRRGVRGKDEALLQNELYTPKDYVLRDAEATISAAVRHFKMEGGSRDEFAALPRGDVRRVAVAWALSRKTSVRQSWVADRLSLRTAGNVSEQVRRFAAKSE